MIRALLRAALVRTENARWAKVIKDAGVKLD